jgi:hypothetical protein
VSHHPLPPALPQPKAWGRLLIACRLPLAALLLLTLGALVFLRKGEQGEWHTCYLRAASRLQDCQIIHRFEPSAYTYPPAMAMFAVPFSRLTPWAALGAWFAVNAVATLIVFATAWRLAGGPLLVNLLPPWRAVVWAGMLLALRFVLAPLENQQSDMLIAALLLTGCWRLRQGSPLWAALWLGAAAAMKCTPLLFAPYLAWRGKPLAACLLVSTALALNLLPDLFWPKASGGSYLVDWAQTFLFKAARAAPGIWESSLTLNQSLAGLVNRATQWSWGISTGLPTELVAVPPAAALVMRGSTYGIGALLLAVTAWRMGTPGWPGQRAQHERAPQPWDQLAGVEASAVFLLMLLLSPMTSKSHYAIVLLPCFMFARGLVEGRKPWFAWIFGALAVLGPLSSKGMLGKQLGDVALACGFPTWFVLLLLAAMWSLLPGWCFTVGRQFHILAPCAGRGPPERIPSDAGRSKHGWPGCR